MIMMDGKRTKLTFLNMAFSLFYNVISFVMRFFMRRYFLEAFGVEILGYNSTFNNILGMLNLAELGVGIAITYKLYEPVAKQNYDEINKYLQIYRKMYRGIGAFILCMGMLLIPILPLILKTGYENILYLGIIFILQLLSTVSSYWLAYKRIVFTVYQETYVVYIIDIFFFVVINILQLVDLFVWKDYILYLFLAIVQVVASNAIATFYCNKRYPQLCQNEKCIISTDFVQELKNDFKNVFAAKVGGYVLNSTDALVVSTILGASYVGYMANYTTIYVSFQNIILSILVTIQPALGNKIVSEKNTRGVESTIFNITFLCQIIGSVFSIVAFFVIEDFIVLWIGEEYILNKIITILFSTNVYIYIVMNPISLLFGALGYFKYDKLIVSIAAVVNILISVVLVYKTGIMGVLLGTTVALVIYWISRTIILYKKYYGSGIGAYVFRIIRCMLINIVAIGIIFLVDKHNECCAETTIGCFLIKGFLYSVIVLVVNIVFYLKTEEWKYCVALLKGLIKRK